MNRASALVSQLLPIILFNRILSRRITSSIGSSSVIGPKVGQWRLFPVEDPRRNSRQIGLVSPTTSSSAHGCLGPVVSLANRGNRHHRSRKKNTRRLRQGLWISWRAQSASHPLAELEWSPAVMSLLYLSASSRRLRHERTQRTMKVSHEA